MTLHQPVKYLSSTDAGWEGMTAEAFHEPDELDGWMTEATSEVALVLFRGGTMCLEQRSPRGHWDAEVMHAGNLILTPGGAVPREVRWKSLTRLPIQTLHLHLHQDLLSRVAEEVSERDGSTISLTAQARLHDPLLVQICTEVWHELEHPSPVGKLYAEAAAQMLAVHLLRQYAQRPVSLREMPLRLTHWQMHRVLDFIHASLEHDLSLSSLAQQAGFSPYHFTRLFRQATGESPHQYVLRLRLERAKQLLETTALPIAHIAQASGFANQSHLTRAFKHQYGATPHHYRHGRRAHF